MHVSDDFLVDKIFPSNRIHLLAGISSSGKSRFILPALIMWAAGCDILGLKSHPVPWCCVCADRPIQDAYDSITTMGFDRRDVDIIPAFGAHSRSRNAIMGQIEESGAKLVLWEGFDMVVKNPNSTGEVRDTLSEITAYCEEGLTIIGTVGVAKLKPHETYQNPRQLVGGSTLWERTTSTNMIVVPTNPWSIAHPERLLYVSLKNSPSFAVLGRFEENGMLCFDDHTKALSEPTMRVLAERMRHRNGNGH